MTINESCSITILRTSVPEDLARATRLLNNEGIPYRIERKNTGGWKFPRHILVVSVEGWYEKAALQAVSGISSEYEMPASSDERGERLTESLAKVHVFALVAAVVVLFAGFLWQRYS